MHLMSRIRKNWRKGLVIGIAILAAGFFLIPLIWMLSTSFKPELEVFSPVIRWVPQKPTLQHYIYSLGGGALEVPIVRWLFNSLFVAATGTTLVVFVDVMAAYALARLNLPFKRFFLGLFVATLMIPWIVIFLPLYLEFNSAKLLNTYVPLIFPYTANAFGVFLLHQFLLGLPVELEEAARLDGANKWQTFTRVIVPLVRPAMITLAILTFINIYNDFLWPLVATNTPEMRTMTVGVAIMEVGSFVGSYGKLMALTTIATAPMVVAFLVGQRYFMRGIAFTGLKM